MKTKFLLRKSIFCSILFLLLWGCFKEPDGFTDPGVSRTQNLTLERARATHETAQDRTTRSEGDFGILYSGNLEPWWDGAKYSECDFSESYDVEVIAERYYEQVHYITDSLAVRSTVFPRLVVVEERLRDRNPTPYVAFYFPDRLTEENYEQDAGEGLLNSLPKEGFSGVIIYTTLKGFPVAASRHAEGRQIDQAFLGDATDYPSLIEAAEHYNRIVENIRIFVSEETRSIAGEEDITWLVISKEGAVITADGQTPAFDIDNETKILPVDWYKLDLSGGDTSNPATPTDKTAPTEGIGDGKAESSLKDGKYDKNEHIQTTSELVAEILDVIYGDCMGKTLIDAIGADITIEIDPNPKKNSYNKDKGIIKFGDGGEGGKQRGYVLLEELIHVYQREQVPDQVYEAAKLNYEIEAKVGWLMYEKRKLSTELEFDQYDLELGSTFLFDEFIKTCYPNYNHENARHKIFYDMVIYQFRPIYPKTDYPESKGNRTFENIEELMKNC